MNSKFRTCLLYTSSSTREENKQRATRPHDEAVVDPGTEPAEELAVWPSLRFAGCMSLFCSPDCTLTGSMVIDERREQAEGHAPARWMSNVAILAMLAGVALAAVVTDGDSCKAQQSAGVPDRLAAVPLTEPATNPLPICEDRGYAALEQDLKRLGTTASVLMIVAHPDDEDGSLLTYLSRGLGVRATLLTLNRGEGGQNAMSADSGDALGIIRTQELLKACLLYTSSRK